MDGTVASGIVRQGWFGSSGFPFQDSVSLNLIKMEGRPTLIGRLQKTSRRITRPSWTMCIYKSKDDMQPKSIDAVMIKFGPGRAAISQSHFGLELG